jgi:hypothetical protein
MVMLDAERSAWRIQEQQLRMMLRYDWLVELHRFILLLRCWWNWSARSLAWAASRSEVDAEDVVGQRGRKPAGGDSVQESTRERRNQPKSRTNQSQIRLLVAWRSPRWRTRLPNAECLRSRVFQAAPSDRCHPHDCCRPAA